MRRTGLDCTRNSLRGVTDSVSLTCMACTTRMSKTILIMVRFAPFLGFERAVELHL